MTKKKWRVDPWADHWVTAGGIRPKPKYDPYKYRERKARKLEEDLDRLIAAAEKQEKRRKKVKKINVGGKYDGYESVIVFITICCTIVFLILLVLLFTI